MACAGVCPGAQVGTSSAQVRSVSAQAFRTVEREEAPLVTIVMGLDQHRAQITAEWIDTSTGEIAQLALRGAPEGENDLLAIKRHSSRNRPSSRMAFTPGTWGECLMTAWTACRSLLAWTPSGN